jgi:8-oxo-dGTP pyrophosphatase MutT (NUDIX family)
MPGFTRSRVEYPVSAGGVVFRQINGRIETVLCGRNNPACWSLAKGTPNEGESLEETALREVREETGLEVHIDAPIGSIEYSFDNRTGSVRFHKTVLFYLMVPIGGSTQLHDLEFDVVMWFPIDEALNTLTYANEANVLQQALPLMSERAGGK